MYANKQDLSDAMSAKQMIEYFGIGELGNMKILVKECSVYKNFGLVEGLSWLVDQLNSKT